GRHLLLRAQSLRGVEIPRLDRRSHRHPGGARAQHHRPRARVTEESVMSMAVHSSTPVPVASHATETGSLEEKMAVRQLNFFYGSHRALKDINVSLYTNKVTAFIGPSGCGKSTLLRILNRVYDLYPHQRAEGEVLLDGKNTLAAGQDLNLLRSRVGMVFQKPTPFPMSIYENIAFGIRLYERPGKAELDARVEQALRRAALWD